MKYFFINDKKFKINISITKNSIIDFCNNINLNIPYFCYHNNLSLAGNCRMCLIEIKNSLKPIVSCTMLLSNNMQIYTNSLLVKKARENVLEFLLLNHPLDCPICDQGGECDLQDQSLIFGSYKKRFYNFKRIIIDKNISPIIKMLMTRCIHCTRCVRFSYEIAGGSNLLGVYNRGVSSEIGTYVSKTFNSELSGNLIDICPVGALTFKQYSFVNRNWELKSLKSIDFSDGFGLDTHVFINKNNVIKIQPADSKDPWISDKTRFSFDGMFTNERNIASLKSEQKSVFYWKSLLKDLILLFYFKDHLSSYFLKFTFAIIINNLLDIQNLNFLYLIIKKFKFIEIKKLEKTTVSSPDREESFRLNSTEKVTNFNLAQFCLLLNLNLRFEGSTFNLKLKHSFLKNNLKIIAINSLINLSFPLLYLGSTLNIINEITGGNNVITQMFVYSKNSLLLHNSEILKRKDKFRIFENFQLIRIYNFTISNSNWNGFNMLSSTLSEPGLNYFDKIYALNFYHYLNLNVLYLFNIKYNFFSRFLQKYLDLKLLVFGHYLNFLVLIEQNFLLNYTFKTFKFYNNNFFENSINTFLNVEGFFKISPKIISSSQFYSKNDQSILNFFDFYLNKLMLCSVNMINPLLYFGYIYFKSNVIDLLSSPSNQLTLLKWSYVRNKFCSFYFPKIRFKNIKLKFFKSKLLLWLEDFYLNSKDLYSAFSLVMLECSKSFRKLENNFLY